jgi:beta-galactosidase
MKLFNGQLVVIVRSAKQPGTLTLKVTDTNMSMTEAIDIQVK